MSYLLQIVVEGWAYFDFDLLTTPINQGRLTKIVFWKTKSSLITFNEELFYLIK